MKDRIHWICLIIALTFAAGLTAFAVAERGLLVEARADMAVEELAGQVLRFHVLAASDSPGDQQVKLKVKEAVLTYLRENMAQEKTLEGTRAFVREHMTEIAEVAKRTVREQGSGDNVRVRLVTEEFPKKQYGDITFPAGKYEALKVEIGSGRGHNWWCCLYPNLCFTDVVHARVGEKDKQALEEVLDEDAYEMITCTSDFKIKWFFFDRR